MSGFVFCNSYYKISYIVDCMKCFLQFRPHLHSLSQRNCNLLSVEDLPSLAVPLTDAGHPVGHQEEGRGHEKEDVSGLLRLHCGWSYATGFETLSRVLVLKSLPIPTLDIGRLSILRG